MKLKQMLLIILMITTVNVAFATHESVIDLRGGIAYPHTAYFVSLKKLVPFVAYNVLCRIESNNKSKQTFDDIKIFAASGRDPVFKVNGTVLARHGQINIPTTSMSQLIASNVKRDSDAIALLNLDSIDTLSIDCFAEPARS